MKKTLGVLRESFELFMHSWRQWLAGVLLAVVLISLAFLLSSCGSPTPYDPNALAIQAQQQAQYYSAMATGTHEAPIMAITQRAADLKYQVEQDSLHATQTAMLWTATPSPIPTITPSPTPNVPMTSTFSALFAMQTQTVLDTQKKETSNQFWAIFWPLSLTALLSVIVLAAITAVRQFRHRSLARDDFGKTQPIMDTVSGKYIDLSANPNYSHEEMSILKQIFIQYLEKKYGFIPQQPRITAERQDRTKEREQIIEVERIRHRKLPKALIDAQAMRFLPEPTEDEDTEEIQSLALPELPAPNWTDLNRWDGKLLPVGNDEQSKLMLVDTSVRPHLMYVGRSRSGKTLTGERTAAACLLTQGWNVIVMGKRVDWMPFVDHPNFKLLAVDVRKDAQKYIDLLQILSAQMDIRDSLMSARHVSTWDRYGAPSTMVIIDDYSGALLRMPKKNADQVTAEVRSIAMDGAKFGLSLTIGLQDATAQNVDTTTRSQMARIVYSLDNATKSRIALGADGAEKLPPFRHFLTRVTDDADVRRGIGFFLQDREVEAFLASRPVPQNGEMEWIEGTFTDVPKSLPAQESIKLGQPKPTLSEWVNARSEWEIKALDLYQGGLDQESILEAVLCPGPEELADLIKRWREIKGVATVTPPAAPEPKPSFSQKVIEQAESIRAQWNPNMNKSQVSRLFGKPNSGAWSDTLNQIIDYLKSSSSPASESGAFTAAAD